MKSQKFIEWEDSFRLGTTIRVPLQITEYCLTSSLYDVCDKYKNVIFNHQFVVAPKFIDSAIHKANRLFKYYTFKELPGAVIFLGAN